MTPQVFMAEAVFDSPKYIEHGKFGPYYTMCISLPPGSPGTEHIKKYDRHQAYLSFNADAEVKDYLCSLTRGDKFQVVWDSSGKGKYYAVLPSDATPQASAPGKQPSNVIKSNITVRPKQESGLLTEIDIMAMQYAIDEVVPILSYAHTVAGRYFPEEPPEVVQKMAVTAFLYAKDRYRGIDPEAAGDIPMLDGEDVDKQITNLDAAGLPQNLLVKIGELSDYVGSGKIAAEYLKLFGVSSDDIDPQDKTTWIRAFNIAHTYGLLRQNVGDREAAIAVANMYNLPIPD